jgi:hypothetical protein
MREFTGIVRHITGTVPREYVIVFWHGINQELRLRCCIGAKQKNG